MGEVSADPLVMLGCVSESGERVGLWRDEAVRLRDALDGLVSGLLAVPEDLRCGVTAELADELVGRLDGIVSEQEHQDGFVRDVAQAVLEADGFGWVVTGNVPIAGGHLEMPEGPLTVSESALAGVVGPATRFEALAEDAGRDADRGLELLEAEGVLATLDGGLDIDDLYEIAESVGQEGELAAWSEEVGPRLGDPQYAAGFYNALGAEGTEGLAALLLTAGVGEVHAGPESPFERGGGGWAHHLGDPFIEGLAAATRSGELERGVLGSLLAFETEEDRLAAGIMFSASGDLYDGQVLGRAAQAVIGSGDQLDDPGEYVTLADAFLMRGLAENPDAAYRFVVDDRGQPVDEFLEVLLDPEAELSHLRDLSRDLGLTEVWFEGPADRIGESYSLWRSAAYLSLMPEEVGYEFRDFNGVVIDGHPWRDPGLRLDDPRFLTGGGYEGWEGADPTTGEEDELYTMWVGEPGGDYESLAFYYNTFPETMSLLADMTPIMGEVKLGYEAATGRDPIAGNEVHQGVAVGGLVLSLGLWGGAGWVVSPTRSTVRGLVQDTKGYLRGRTPPPPDQPVHLTSIDDAARYGSEVWGDVPLSRAEEASLRTYALAGHQQINNHLRGVPARRYVLVHIDNIDQALARRPLPEDVHVSRTIFSDDVGSIFPDLDSVADMRVGYRSTDPGYMSTRLDNQIMPEIGEGNILLNLEVPSGTPAWSMSQSGRNISMPEEAELLLGRGLTWEVTAPPELRNGIWIIDARVLPPS